jgi:hypothetical protein
MRLRYAATALLALTGACGQERPAADSGPLDAMARRYVVLGLGLGRHDPNYVDAYYGPDALKAAAAAESLSVAEVRAAAESLVSLLGDSAPAYADSLVRLRHRYLRVQLGAMGRPCPHARRRAAGVRGGGPGAV